MAPRLRSAESPWISLGAACRLLKVSESTLRQWADSGRIRSYRTPGGHRRFSREDLYALMEGTRPVPEGAAPITWNEAALRRIRRRLRASRGAHPSWFDRMDDATRIRLRLFGHRLLELASQFIRQRRQRALLLEETRAVGEEYGAELARQGVPFTQVVEAYAFFRNTLVDTLLESATTPASRGEEVRQLWHQVNQVTDAVLHGMAQAYDAHAYKRGVGITVGST